MPTDTATARNPNHHAEDDTTRLSHCRDALEEAPEPPRRSLRDTTKGLLPRNSRHLRRPGAAVLLLVAILWIGPMVILLSALLVFWIALGAVVILGPSKLWDRLVRRRPQLAEALRQRADRLAVYYDAVLDRLPASWAENLYLPDLSQPIRNDPRASNDPRMSA